MEEIQGDVRHRSVLGWVVGIVVLALGVIGFDVGGDAVGAVSHIELDEPITVTHGNGIASWDEEVDTLTTWYGQMTGLLSLVVAVWAGFAASTARLDAGWKRGGWHTYCAWLMGLSTLSLLALLSELAFPKDPARWLQITRNLLSLGLTAVVAQFCYRWWKMRAALHDAKSE